MSMYERLRNVPVPFCFSSPDFAASYGTVVNTSLALKRYTELIGNPLRLGRPKKQMVYLHAAPVAMQSQYGFFAPSYL